jgi:hypothetical protein
MRQFQESIRLWEGIPTGCQSNWEHVRQAREHRGHVWEQLRVWPTNLAVLETNIGTPATHMGVPATHLGAPATSLGAPRITVEQFWKTTPSLGNLQVYREIIVTPYRSSIFTTHVFSLHSRLCISIATHLHRV